MREFSKEYVFIKIILSTFKVFGLAPLTLRGPVPARKSAKRDWQVQNDPRCFKSRLGSLYNVALILVQLYMWRFVAEPQRPGVAYPGKSGVTSIFEVLLSINGNAVVVLVWSKFIVKRSDLAILVNRLIRVDETLKRVNGKKKLLVRNNYDSKNCLILIAANALTLIILLLSEHYAFHAPTVTWFCFVVPSIVTNWLIVQYFLVLKTIEARFRRLNAIFRDCTINSIVFPLRCFLIEDATIDDLRVTKIGNLRRAHTWLYEISCRVADFYSLPILPSIGFVSFLIIYNGYYLLLPAFIETEEQTGLMLFNTIFWLVVFVTPIFMLAAGVNGVIAEMKRTADVIPALLARPTTSSQDKIELRMFCFDLLHKKVEFTAYNLFPLDGTLLQSVVGTMTAYLTIIFQFQAGSSSRASARVYTNITTARRRFARV